MPTYEYECETCRCKFETFQKMSDDPLTLCPECGNEDLIKLISCGAAAIVKGTSTPCNGGRERQKKDRLGEGKYKGATPPWRTGPINKDILKNPKKYIAEGEI